MFETVENKKQAYRSGADLALKILVWQNIWQFDLVQILQPDLGPSCTPDHFYGLAPQFACLCPICASSIFQSMPDQSQIENRSGWLTGNRLFWHIFVIGEISIGGGFPDPSPFGYAYAPSEENKKGVRKFSARFLAFSNKILMIQKIVLSSSRGHGNFRGLEALRPRTWTFEAKDLKMCPRGLHLRL